MNSITQQILDRCQARQLSDEEGSPTDAMILSASKLARFLTPHAIRRRTDSGFHVRVEWLGRYETGEGTDLFAIEKDLVDKIARKLADDAMRKTVVTNVDSGN